MQNNTAKISILQYPNTVKSVGKHNTSWSLMQKTAVKLLLGIAEEFPSMQKLICSKYILAYFADDGQLAAGHLGCS